MGALDFLSNLVPEWPFGAAVKPSDDGLEPTSAAATADILPPDVVRTATADDLKFHAAASRQIPGIGEPVDPRIIDETDLSGRLHGHHNHLLVASPYIDEDHLLDLDTLSRPNQLFAKALTVMNARTREYAVEPYVEAFNWNEVVDALRKLARRESYAYPRSEFYIIVFRSRLPPDADREHLGQLDKDAHLEAVESGQLLKYWFGTPHPDTGRNLATCVWRHRDDAKKGGSGPGHIRAMEAVRSIYLEWRVERLKFVVEENVSSWSIDKWVD
ncbi:hypothetical protein Dda_5965 [Drechslerella dactyloides]|uniref:Uncharacterized protein n=1 Tax=Drechslerella dactyloides TaxID=74499 RepID=A0AAD6IUQ1_DREDA|nr:hypothetical protein Dda_5965 [Drechslerella dactyloides]